MVAAACSGDSFADATACVSEGGVAWLLFVVVGIGVHDALMRGGDDVMELTTQMWLLALASLCSGRKGWVRDVFINNKWIRC